MGRVSQLSIVVAHLFTHAGRGFLSLVILQSHGGGGINVYRIEICQNKLVCA